MFNKELNKFEKVINAIFLISILFLLGDFLIEVINAILPQGGDYSNFDLKNFIYGFFDKAFTIGLLVLYLKLTKMFKLFSNENVTLKKLLNFVFASIILVAVVNFKTDILKNMFGIKYYWMSSAEEENLIKVFFEDYLPFIVVPIVSLYYINTTEILSDKKTTGLNLFNAIAIGVIASCTVSTYFTIIYGPGYNEVLVDSIRNILINLVPALLFGLGLYFVNKGYMNKENTYHINMKDIKENKRKYAELLLLKCLGMKGKKSLLIEGNEHTKEFCDILKEEAIKIGVEDVYISIRNAEEKHELSKNLSMEEIKENALFDKSIYNVYTLKNAGILMLSSPIPDLMSDIPNDKLVEIQKYERSTQEIYRKKQHINEVNWCIACVPNKLWANKLFNEENNLEKLWDLIFDICLVKEKDPILAWDNRLEENKKLREKLTSLNLDKLHYKNSLGTDLTIKLPENHVWCGGTIGNGLIVNMPTLEIFTSPLMHGVDGVVYSAKPLIYNNITIDNFKVEFKEGKVINVTAEKGLETLQGIIDTDEYSCYLGEVALVPYDSPISNTNVVFEDTLIDENASCHLAFGSSYPECVKGAEKLGGDELRNLGVNDSKAHVDFMIGTNDLEIIGTLKDGTEVKIFENGNFSKDLY